MEYSKKEVEKYILLGYNPKKKRQKKRSVEKNVLYSGHGSCFLAMVVLVIFHVFAIYGDYPMRILPVNLSIVFLTPLIILMALKFCRFGLTSSINKSPQKKINPFILILSTGGAIIGVIFARAFLSNIPYSVEIIIVSVITVLLVLLFVFLSCIDYYRVHLIRKFCPYLKEKKLF